MDVQQKQEHTAFVNHMDCIVYILNVLRAKLYLMTM